MTAETIGVPAPCAPGVPDAAEHPRRPDAGDRSGPGLHPFRGVLAGGAPAAGRDAHPALYVLEQHRGSTLLQRGVIGALDLSRAPGAVLPHERVLPAKVALQARLTRSNGGNAEPILLTYEGGADAARVLADVTRRRPDAAATAPDGTVHRLWRCADPARQAVLAADAAGSRALIADGHHRYAAALRLHRNRRGRPGPWDRLPALLVDTGRHPLRLRAIHRHLPGLDPLAAVAKAAQVAEVTECAQRAPRTGEFIIVGAGRSWSVTAPHPRAIRAALREGPEEWHALDAAVLDRLFIDTLWRTPTGPPVVDYTTSYAYEGIGGGPVPAPPVPPVPRAGTLVLLAPPRAAEVRRLAGLGVRMPQKTTSFGPKPLPGLVMYPHAPEG